MVLPMISQRSTAVRPGKRLVLLSLAAGLALAVACGRPDASREKTAAEAESRAESPKKNAVILRVGETYYFSADFDAYIARLMGNSPDKLTPESLSRLFDGFVEDKLLLEAARRQGIELTDEEEARYQAKIQEEMDPERNPALGAADIEALNEKLLIEKYTYSLVQDVSVTDGEVHAYYTAHKSDFLQPERVKVSQILLKTEEKAIDVLARVKALPADGFRSVARQESVGPESGKSGEMGTFSPGQLPYQIEKVIFSLQEGEISQIVESSYGYHIFRLDKRFEPELVSEEQAAPSIRTKLLDGKISQAVAAHLKDLRASLDWVSTPENLSFAYQRNTP
jgi:parvulin-like peptidyl-prolyl isomerase